MSKSSNKVQLQTYTIWAKLNVVVAKNIKAASLGEALTQSRELKENDFVEFLGDYNDGSMKVLGVMEDY